MRFRIILLILSLPLVAGWSDRDPLASSWPYAGPMPDKAVTVPATRYEPVGAGDKSFRPVEPMPWGDVNKRVAPAGPRASKPSNEPR